MTVHNGTLDTRAVLAEVDELAAPPADGAGRHPLPDLAALQAAARSWGLHERDAVVVYDDNGGLAAARAWWLLRWAGVADVRILDGGLPAWRAAGHPVAVGDETAEPGDVTLSAGPPVLDPDGVVELLDEGGLLLDARSSDRYRGDIASVDPRPGHIPGALSAPTTENLTDDGHFRAPAALAERFAALGIGPGRPVGVYCGSGVTAAHEIAALTLAGVTDVRLYPGSFSQWAAHPDRPVVTGPHPRPAPEPPVDVTGGPELISPVEASRRGPYGVPLLADPLAWLVCRVADRIDAGDHVIVLASPLLGEHDDDPRPPLLYHRGDYLTNP